MALKDNFRIDTSSTPWADDTLVDLHQVCCTLGSFFLWMLNYIFNTWIRMVRVVQSEGPRWRFITRTKKINRFCVIKFLYRFTFTTSTNPSVCTMCRRAVPRLCQLHWSSHFPHLHRFSNHALYHLRASDDQLVGGPRHLDQAFLQRTWGVRIYLVVEPVSLFSNAASKSLDPCPVEQYVRR